MNVKFTRAVNRSLIPVAAPSKAWVCGLLLAGIAGSNPAGAWMSLVIVVCCEVVGCASGRSLDHKSPTECGVSECDLETSTLSRP